MRSPLILGFFAIVSVCQGVYFTKRGAKPPCFPPELVGVWQESDNPGSTLTIHRVSLTTRFNDSRAITFNCMGLDGETRLILQSPRTHMLTRVVSMCVRFQRIDENEIKVSFLRNYYTEEDDWKNWKEECRAVRQHLHRAVYTRAMSAEAML